MSPEPSQLDKFYHLNPGNDAKAISVAISDKLITQEDAEILNRFIADMRVTRNISYRRVLKLTFTLIQWRRFIGPFRSNTIPDLYLGVDRLRNGVNAKGNPFAPVTIHDYIIILKQFYRWATDEEFSSISLPKLQKIKTPPVVTRKNHNDILSQEEIIKILEHCRNSMDRCLISILYEGGFRIGELATMTWEDLKIDGTGTAVLVTFKTLKTRHVRLVMSQEHIIKWKGDYPGSPTGSAPVFVTRNGETFNYESLVKRMRRIATQAKIEKHITPHIFRHSRITHLILQGTKESVIKLMMWGDVSTDMFKVYAHLAPSDIDREVYRIHGMELPTQVDAEISLSPRICTHCHEMNSPISQFCHRCGQSLVEESPMEYDQLHQFIMKNQKVFLEYFTSIGKSSA